MIESVSIAAVGLGGWGKNIVRTLASTPRCNLSMICDAHAETLAERAESYPGARPTRSFDDVLGSDVGAIALATPAPLHYSMAAAALKAGKHVFVEKPMTLNSNEAATLVSLAHASQRKLMVGHLLEYHPAVNAMKTMVAAGKVGTPFHLYCRRLNLGVVRREENAFWSLAPHDISISLYLFGEEPSHVSAAGNCFLQPGIEDLVYADLNFPSGRSAHIHVSWLDPFKTRTMVLIGSEGMLVFDDLAPKDRLCWYPRSCDPDSLLRGARGPIRVRDGEAVPVPTDSTPPLEMEIKHFIDAVMDDRTPLSDGHDGVRVVRVLERVDHCLAERRSKGVERAVPLVGHEGE